MNKLMIGAASALAMAVAAAPAYATDVNQVLVLDATNSAGFSTPHGAPLEADGTAFTDTYTFLSPFSGDIAAAAAVSISVTTTNYLNLTSLALNGGTAVNFTRTNTTNPDGTTGYMYMASTTAPTQANNSLVILGSVAGTGGRYSGNVSVSQVTTAPTPEPATWGMMMLGLGMIGAGVRSRRRSTRVTFA